MLSLLTGCLNQGTPPTRSRTSATSAAQSGQQLFEAAILALNDLPSAVDLRLRTPTVVLDASTSRNGKTVMATVGARHHESLRRFDLLQVVTRNGRFGRLKIRAGDRVRYFIADRGIVAQINVVRSSRFRQLAQGPDGLNEEVIRRLVDLELQRIGESRLAPIELTVAKVIDDNTLVLAESLPFPVASPQRMEIWRFADERVEEISRRLARYTRGRGPMVDWEPTPDEVAVQKVVDRLNGWVRRRSTSNPWTADPMVDQVPSEWRQAFASKRLSAADYQASDARRLQETVWLRDIARWVGGDRLDELAVARALFDWTVRNIQLVDDLSQQPELALHRPWQILLYGVGTAEQRAWVLAQLARQQGLDVVILALPGADNAPPTFWLPALLSAGQLYLLDTRLGLPIPTADGQGIATLAETRNDPEILRRLDLGKSAEKYPVQAGDLNQLVALVAVSPFELSRRAQAIERQLASQQQMVLTAAPAELADRVQKLDGIAKVRFWDLPLETEQAARRPNQQQRANEAARFLVFATDPYLWKARVLHFAGEFRQGTMAKTLYRRARQLAPSSQKSPRSDYEQTIRRQARMHASYWLGLMAFDEGNYGSAADFFEHRTLQAFPEGSWTAGARYNLARTLEATGAVQQALELYQADQSAQQHGNRLRARRLQPSPSNAP